MKIEEKLERMWDHCASVLFVFVFTIMELLLVAPYVYIARLMNYKAYRKGVYHDPFPSLVAGVLDNRKKYLTSFKKKLKSVFHTIRQVLRDFADYPFIKK